MGKAEGEALVTSEAISFFGGVDPDSGLVVERGHELQGETVALQGETVAGKVLVFPKGKGSTVGSYTLYRLKYNQVAPSAIINAECETIIAVGCIISDIPCVDQVEIEKIETGTRVTVDGDGGKIIFKG